MSGKEYGQMPKGISAKRIYQTGNITCILPPSFLSYRLSIDYNICKFYGRRKKSIQNAEVFMLCFYSINQFLLIQLL